MEWRKASHEYPIIGEIRLGRLQFRAQGWLLCQGQLLSIPANSALFNLIGTTYGGDGVNNFGLPDLRGRAILSSGTDVSRNTYAIGQSGGAESVTLITTQPPAHTHTIAATTNSASASSPAGQTFAASDLGQYEAVSNTLTGPIVGPRGGGQPHENRMPFAVLSYIIATEGIYPSQN